MNLQTVDALDTPALLVDLDRVEANLLQVRQYMHSHGLRWRPHAKTHKVPHLAALQLVAGASGLTVATLREAEVMATVANDILVAYPPVGPSRLARLVSLPPHLKLTVALDSRESLHALAEAARSAGRSVGVLVELDMGMRRVGVQTPEEAVALAQEAAQAPALEYLGVTFYPGHVRQPLASQGPALAEVARRLGAVREALERAGLAPAWVSGGSTPTLWRSHEVPGLSEVRAGIAPFFDASTAAFGVCRWQDCAVAVLATVVSTAVPGQAVIDAGSKALPREEMPGGGFGALWEHPGVRVHALSEEHGLLDVSASEWRPRLGERVRVVPSHVCNAVNLHEHLCAVRGQSVVERWPVLARGWAPFRADLTPSLS